MAVFVLLPVAAWVQHIEAAAAAGRWLWLALGALIFPLGVLNGIAVWLGVPL